MLHRHKRLTILAKIVKAYIVIAVAGNVAAQTCPALTTELRSRLEAYVTEQYGFAPDLMVRDEGTVGGACFRRIAVDVAAPKRTLQLFLSPDQRFLTEALMDTTLSPKAERQRVAQETEQVLNSDVSPFQGPRDALITLVVFSDFQCPFCKRFEDILNRLPEKARQDIRVVFKQRPLAMHTWARRAALAAICVSSQSQEAFWRFEQLLFADQDKITLANLDERIAAFGAQNNELNPGRLRGCMENGTAEKTLLRDEKLADAYHVDAVPTIFINGIRSTGFRTPEELEAGINAARAYLSTETPRVRGLTEYSRAH